MKDGLKIGLEYELVRVVTRDLCVLATRTPPVFATAEMVKLMEFAAYQVLEPFYEEYDLREKGTGNFSSPKLPLFF